MMDHDYPGNFVSPRRQGAGQIDVAKASGLTVTAEGTDQTGSVSLQQFEAAPTFTITLTNHGTTDQTYTVVPGHPSRKPLTPPTLMAFYAVALPGATLTTATPTFTLKAGASQTVAFTLTLDQTVRLHQVIEGFISFKATDDSQSISMPYMGFMAQPMQKSSLIMLLMKVEVLLQAAICLMKIITHWALPIRSP